MIKKKIDFHLVVGNSDHLKVDSKKIPIWKFIDRPLLHKLTSIMYCPPLEQISGKITFDCGAWSYRDKEEPTWDIEGCIKQYNLYANGGDCIISPDHMILANQTKEVQEYRLNLTLDNAKKFIKVCPKELVQMAVTHGNDINTRVLMTQKYLDMGYKKIAVGGIAGRAGRLSNSKGITQNARCVIEIIEAMINDGAKELHILGVGSLPWVEKFLEYPEIKSYDTASMFKQAFSAGTYNWINEDNPTQMLKYNAEREMNVDNSLPECNCLACVSMKRQGYDTRTYGSNENNMGRAVHNINMYLRSLDLLKVDWGKNC